MIQPDFSEMTSGIFEQLFDRIAHCDILGLLHDMIGIFSCGFIGCFIFYGLLTIFCPPVVRVLDMLFESIAKDFVSLRDSLKSPKS